MDLRGGEPIAALSGEFEIAAIAQDLVRAPRHALGWLSGPPGWSPDGSRETSGEIKRKWAERRAAEPAEKRAA